MSLRPSLHMFAWEPKSSNKLGLIYGWDEKRSVWLCPARQIDTHHIPTIPTIYPSYTHHIPTIPHLCLLTGRLPSQRYIRCVARCRQLGLSQRRGQSRQPCRVPRPCLQLVFRARCVWWILKERTCSMQMCSAKDLQGTSRSY